MKVFVVFGSQSDENVFRPLCSLLDERGFTVDFEVLSAHRQPQELSVALEEKSYDVVVAGAGLSAHLPGVVASKVSVPVFGIPVAAHLGGLDSLFSIFQMPFGVPVTSCVPGRTEDIVDFLQAFPKVNDHSNINIVVDPVISNYEYVALELKRTREYMDSKGVACHVGETVDSKRWNIRLVREADDIVLQGANVACLHVPIMEKNILQSPSKALDLFYMMKTGGLWVGINNTRNAVASYLRFRRGQ